MKRRKIGIGIIGLSATGGWASAAHVPALRTMPDDFIITGLSASTKASAKTAAEAHGVGFYTDDPVELAAHPDVDLVVITVKVPFHRELVEAAIQAGKMIYCEWPLARSAEEAEHLAALVKQAGVRNFVGLQARSAPPVRYLRDLVQSGAIGTVLSSSIIASGGPPWGGIATSKNAYATDRSTGAHMLSIPFGHTIDALTWTLGDFRQINSTLTLCRKTVTLSDTGATVEATAPDNIAIGGVLENGTVISMHYRGGASRGTNFLWEINGTEGDLIVTGDTGHVQFGLIRIQLARSLGSPIDMPVPADYLRAEVPAESRSFAVANAYCRVADDIRSGSKTVPDFADALKLHRLLERIETASQA
jgi:predicted dehydrogenase